jgi:DNA-directed RNA polymerase subunit N (RpoN/RPB10)
MLVADDERIRQELRQHPDVPHWELAKKYGIARSTVSCYAGMDIPGCVDCRPSGRTQSQAEVLEAEVAVVKAHEACGDDLDLHPGRSDGTPIPICPGCGRMIVAEWDKLEEHRQEHGIEEGRKFFDALGKWQRMVGTI